ncbi:SMP-30/gluconolactonase/LRE family protein [Novosphingobium sp. PS1R-30]|uniref:SMP-30/gluconolactonase/LRE family protein n=1 Tax=Novosphingobium anseongense TaxID=3133436 RepID=A0ABU8S1M3_9SPHN
MKITRLEAPICQGGENPMWDAATQRLYYIDNSGCKVHSYEPATGATRTLDMPTVVTTLVLREGGGAVVTLRSGIHFLDLETGALEMVDPLPDPPPYVYNDGKVDSRGRFLMGGSTANFTAPAPDGGLFRLDPDRTVTRLDSNIHFSNSPCWSPDERTFYFSDSWVDTTFAYDYDIETGGVSNRRVFVNTREIGGLPDGATVDVDGLYWVAVYQAGKVAAYRPDGTLARVIDMPVKLVSSVAFGGPDLDRLFVTTIAHGTQGEPTEEGAGALYVIDGLGAKGRLENRFAG